MSEDTAYRIYCNDGEQTICQADNLNDLFARFLKLVGRHNNFDDSENHLCGCEDLVKEMSFDIARGGFSSRSWEIQEGRIEEKMVFE